MSTETLGDVVPIIYGDGVHDDSAGLQAAINGEPFEDRSGRVLRHPLDLEGARYGLMVERANLVLDTPVSLERYNGQTHIISCTIRTGGLGMFRDSSGQGEINIDHCRFESPPPEPPDPKADARAESLLRSWLTPEQLRDWVSARYFTVEGGLTGRLYLVGEGCYELGDGGEKVAYLCFGPVDWTLPSSDRVLAKKLALECDEETVLRIANRTPTVRWHDRQAAMQAQVAAMTEAVFYQGAGATQALAQQQAQALQNAQTAMQQARANVAHAEARLATAEADLAAFDAMQARAHDSRQRRHHLLDIAYGALIVVGLCAFFGSILLS